MIIESLQSENAKLREEVAALKVKPLHYEYETVVKMRKEWVDEIVKLREELAEAKRVTFDPAVLEKMNQLEKQRDKAIEALEMIAGKRYCLDALMSNSDVAKAALANIKESK